MTDEHGLRGEQEIYAALRELREEPYGVTRSARTEEVVEAAERLELHAPHASAMLELLSAYEYGDELRKAPVLFSRILSLFEQHPEAFDERGTHSVFWCFKWITTSLLALPEVPLASVEGWIGKMREQYTAAGKPLQAVRTSEYKLAAHTGVGQDLAFELWATRPRDEFSDCAACEARERGSHWEGRGEDERALREWRPVLEDELTCAEEPGATISRALLPLARLGRLQEAASFHRVGYRATRGRVSADGEVARHLEFLALTGNAARGIELLAENRGRFDTSTDGEGRLAFLTGVLVLLGRLTQDGGGEVPVAGPEGRTYTAAELFAELSAQAEGIAAAFDARNGTSAFGERYRARLAQRPVTAEPLPLGVHVAASPAAAAVVAPPVQAEPLPDDFAALLERARAALKIGRPDSGACWDAVAERAGEADLDDVLRAELADRAAFKHVGVQEWAEAAAGLRGAADLFEKAGEHGRAASRRSRAAWAAHMLLEDLDPEGSGESTAEARSAAQARSAAEVEAEVWAELEAASAAAQALTERNGITAEDFVIVAHSRAATAFHALALSARSTSEPEPEARALFDRENAAFLGHAVRLAVPERAAIAEATASQVLQRDGRLEEALAGIDRALAHAEAAERPWAIPQFVVHRGVLLNALGRLDDAANELHRALNLLATWPDTEMDTGGILMELAHNRMRAKDPGGAIEHLTSAAARFDRSGEPPRAAHARALLGQALLHVGRAADAVAVFESLLDEEGEAELVAPERAQIRLDLGRALLQQDEPRTAAEVLTRLAEFVADWPDREIMTLVAAEVGLAVYAAGLWEQGPAAVERALALHAEAPNPAAVCKMLRIAAEAEFRAHGEEGVDRALDLLRRADEVNDASAEVEGGYRRWPETAQTADVRVQALASAGRDEQALAAAEAAVAAWQLGGDLTVGETAEAVRVASIIEGFRLGRTAEAGRRLSPMISRCRAVGHGRAVSVLTKLAEDLQKQGARG